MKTAWVTLLLTGIAWGTALGAQPAPPSSQGKVIVLVTSHEPDKVGIALYQAHQLLKGGVDVKLVFIGRGVVALADLAGKIPDQRRQNALKIKADDPKGEHKQRFAAAMETFKPNHAKSKDRFTQIRAAALPILACGASARNLALDDDLQAAGIPMSDPQAMLDLTPWVTSGYQILTF